jgi:hypothetical protein
MHLIARISYFEVLNFRLIFLSKTIRNIFVQDYLKRIILMKKYSLNYFAHYIFYQNAGGLYRHYLWSIRLFRW